MGRPTDTAIRDQENEAAAITAEGASRYFGLTFEEGVSAALRWVLGDEPDPPIEEA